ncbi:PAAR domain-containing protein [Photobacterium japonica]|uniref:PAAR domain-containing protein n=1 Tax=Photobacterium japonica TaxID=2910235 RepID=UPI003D0C12F2
MGKPAARLNDNHSCPAYSGKTPHVGGPIAAGSPNVLIGGMPAARAGDMLICNGPPDTISAGSASVFINGKPAARMGDKTAHGGVVVGGCGSVSIGDAGIVVKGESQGAVAGGKGKNGESTGSKIQQTPSKKKFEISRQILAMKSQDPVCDMCEPAQVE